MLNFKEAVEKNDIKAVKEYLENIDLSSEDTWTICRASDLGHIEVVRLLLSVTRVNPSANNNWVICLASRSGHTEVVKLLLSDPRVDPSNGNNNWAIRLASNNGHTEIVRLLLSDSRVDFNPIINEEMKEQMLKEERNKLSLIID